MVMQSSFILLQLAVAFLGHLVFSQCLSTTVSSRDLSTCMLMRYYSDRNYGNKFYAGETTCSAGNFFTSLQVYLDHYNSNDHDRDGVTAIAAKCSSDSYFKGWIGTYESNFDEDVQLHCPSGRFIVGVAGRFDHPWRTDHNAMLTGIRIACESADLNSRSSSISIMTVSSEDQVKDNQMPTIQGKLGLPKLSYPNHWPGDTPWTDPNHHLSSVELQKFEMCPKGQALYKMAVFDDDPSKPGLGASEFGVYAAMFECRTKVCHPHCYGSACTGPGSGQCLSCAGSAYLSGGNCYCATGYTRSGNVCREICDDRCSSTCSQPARSYRTLASPEYCVGSCKGGYVKISSSRCVCDAGYAYADENVATCTDVDECEYKALNKCDHTTKCRNTQGGYACDCRPGREPHPTKPYSCIPVQNLFEGASSSHEIVLDGSKMNASNHRNWLITIEVWDPSQTTSSPMTDYSIDESTDAPAPQTLLQLDQSLTWGTHTQLEPGTAYLFKLTSQKVEDQGIEFSGVSLLTTIQTHCACGATKVLKDAENGLCQKQTNLALASYCVFSVSDLLKTNSSVDGFTPYTKDDLCRQLCIGLDGSLACQFSASDGKCEAYFSGSTNFTNVQSSCSSFKGLLSTHSSIDPSRAQSDETCRTRILGDTTGFPVGVSAHQDEGKIYLQWTDSSLCEEGFSFERYPLGSPTLSSSFAEDYMFITNEKCGREHEPQQVFDDLKKSRLAILSKHKYCVSAVAGSDSVNKYASTPSCATHTVLFDAKLTLLVELEESAGSLPVEDVSIRWTTGDPSSPITTWNLLKTNKVGSVIIEIKDDASLAKDTATLTFALQKNTGAVEHSFLCETKECGKFQLQIEHLDFDREYVVVDDTSEPFSGRVFIGDTKTDGPFESGGCPLGNATVCLHLFDPTKADKVGNMIVCVESDNKGQYSMPAVLGLQVIPVATWRERDLVLAHRLLEKKVDKLGVKISEEDVASREFVDFFDYKKESLLVEAVGGACNRPLGVVTLHLSRVSLGCSADVWNQEFSIPEGATERTLRVPAHFLDVSFFEVRYKGLPQHQVPEYFKARFGDLRFQGIDLENVPAESATDSPADLNQRLVRFEYHPEPSIDLSFSGGQVSAEDYGCSSDILILTSNAHTTAKIKVEEKFYGDIKNCDIVDGELVIQNNLGEKERWADDLGIVGAKKELLTVCREAPCKQVLLHETEPEQKFEFGTCNEWQLVANVWHPANDRVPRLYEGLGPYNRLSTYPVKHNQVLIETGHTSVGSERDRKQECTRVKREAECNPAVGCEWLSEFGTCSYSLIESDVVSRRLYTFPQVREALQGRLDNLYTGSEIFPLGNNPLGGKICNDVRSFKDAPGCEKLGAGSACTDAAECQQDGSECVQKMTYPYTFLNQPSHQLESSSTASKRFVCSVSSGSQFMEDVLTDKGNETTFSSNLKSYSTVYDPELRQSDIYRWSRVWVRSVSSEKASICDLVAADQKCPSHCCEMKVSSKRYCVECPLEAGFFQGAPLDCSRNLKTTTAILPTMRKNSHFDLKLIVGAPEQNKNVMTPETPHTKLFRVSALVPFHAAVDVMAHVIVKGDRELSKFGSVGLPQWTPLLIIRDPPGGNSFAFYEHMTTAFVVEIEERERFLGFRGEASIGIGGGAWSCTLAGIVCGATVNTNTMVGFGAEIEYDDLEFKFEKENSISVTTTISMKTGDNVDHAGYHSDMFLIPIINLIFIESSRIDLDGDTCLATAKEIFTWDLDEQNLAFSWVTYEDILVEIDRLEKLKDAKDAESNDPGEDLKAREAAKQAAKQLQKGKLGWNEVLQKYEETNEKARACTRDSTSCGKLNALTYANSSTALNFMPAGMLAHSSPLEGSASGVSTMNSLQNIKKFKFTGGGNELAYTFSNSKDHSRLTDSSGHYFSHEEYLYLDSSSNLLGVSTDIVAHLGIFSSQNRFSGTTKGTSQETTIGFTLGDPDIGDRFDIYVLQDPLYKTFMFVTESGQSQCPWEPNTVAREQPVLTSLVGPAGLTLPDQPAIFTLTIANNNPSIITNYYVYVYNQDNTDGLRIMVNGQSLVIPMLLTCSEPGKAYHFMMEVFRGPLLYNYKPIRVGINSECDTIYFPTYADQSNPSNLLLSANYLRDCPRIEFSGLLWDERNFVVNIATDEKEFFPGQLLVTARNPEKVLYKDALVAPAAAPPSTETVKWLTKATLQFRLAGAASTAWRNALDRENKELDAIKEESQFGFSTLKWNTQPFPDGRYELRLITKCRYVADAPEDINERYSSQPSTVLGEIDRTRPELFGKILPKDGRFRVGDTFEIEFTEPIQCVKPFRFSLLLVVAGYQRKLNQDNLAVLCSGSKIRVSLPVTVPFDRVQGKSGQLSVANIEDLSRNKIAKSISHMVAFESVQLFDAQVVLNNIVLREMELPENATALAIMKQKVVEEISKSLGLDQSRFEVIKVVKISEEGVNGLSASIKIKKGQGITMLDLKRAYTASSSSRRLLSSFDFETLFNVIDTNNSTTISDEEMDVFLQGDDVATYAPAWNNVEPDLVKVYSQPPTATAIASDLVAGIDSQAFNSSLLLAADVSQLEFETTLPPQKAVTPAITPATPPMTESEKAMWAIVLLLVVCVLGLMIAIACCLWKAKKLLLGKGAKYQLVPLETGGTASDTVIRIPKIAQTVQPLTNPAKRKHTLPKLVPNDKQLTSLPKGKIKLPNLAPDI